MEFLRSWISKLEPSLREREGVKESGPSQQTRGGMAGRASSCIHTTGCLRLRPD